MRQRPRLSQNQLFPSWTNRLTRLLPAKSGRLGKFARAVTLSLFALTLATAAHAQGTIDFSGANGVMTSFKTFALFAGAIICFGGLVFAGIRMMAGRFQDAIPVLFGALFGAGVLGWGAGWIGMPALPVDWPCRIKMALMLVLFPRRAQLLRSHAVYGHACTLTGQTLP